MVDLPPDPDEMNDARAEWAGAAVEAFQQQTGTDLPDALCDLLGDLMHWCDRNGQHFNAELSRAIGHYREETTKAPAISCPKCGAASGIVCKMPSCGALNERRAS